MEIKNSRQKISEYGPVGYPEYTNFKYSIIDKKIYLYPVSFECFECPECEIDEFFDEESKKYIEERSNFSPIENY